MRLGKLCLAAAAACVGLASAAQAAITATWVQSNPTAAAITADPILGTMQSWILNITHTDGDWASAGLNIVLTGGDFYNAVGGSDTQPNPALFPALPALEFDTYVSSPNNQNGAGGTTILGGFPTGGSSLSGNVFSVSWGDLTTNAPGTFRIARVTFPSNLTTVAQVNVLTQDDPGDEASFTSQTNPDEFALIEELIPEPSSLSFLALAGLMAMRRRV